MDYSELKIADKKKLLIAESNNLDKLISMGLQISPKELAHVHNALIPISFYQNFDISVNDFIKFMLKGGSSLKDDLKEQILKEILDNEIELSSVQRFVVNYDNITTESLDLIQKKYNILYTPILFNYKNGDYKVFADLFLFDLAQRLRYFGITAISEKDANIIKYLLNYNEDNWDFSSVLKSAIMVGDLSLIKIMLERNIYPETGWWFETIFEKELTAIFDLISEYLGKDKIYELLLTVLSEAHDFRVHHTLIFIKYMATINIKDYDEVISDLLKNTVN